MTAQQKRYLRLWLVTLAALAALAAYAAAVWNTSAPGYLDEEEWIDRWPAR